MRRHFGEHVAGRRPAPERGGIGAGHSEQVVGVVIGGDLLP
jgi:hypothetical protein